MYYLGFQRIDQFTSLALDEVLTEQAKNGDTFIRIFEISPPAITVAVREDLSDVNRDFIQKKGIDLTRRHTPGSAIYCDDKVLCLSVASPIDGYSNPKQIHIKLSTEIAHALKTVGMPQLYIGNWFSIRTTNQVHFPNVLAGFSVDLNVGSMLYHGIIMKSKQDSDFLRQIIRLRKMKGIDEYDYIKKLPTIADYVDVDDAMLQQAILERLTGGRYVEMGGGEYDMLLKRAHKLADAKYRNPVWISSGSLDGKRKSFLRKDLGYCLADLFYPESTIYKVDV